MEAHLIVDQEVAGSIPVTLAFFFPEREILSFNPSYIDGGIMATKDPVKRRAQWKKWYEDNKRKPEYRKRLREFDDNRRKQLIEWFCEYRKTLSCAKCGFAHPAALDFHHRNPEEKLYEVSVMPGKSISKDKILAEIAKCDVLCANCHRIFHYEEKLA